MELEQKVIKIIAESLEVNEDQLSEDTAIGDIPEWNSLGHIVIISSLEKEFSINFDPEIIMDLEDVSDIVAAIEERLKNN
jgi:acyl carrier protein